jgi:hypothetical protein
MDRHVARLEKLLGAPVRTRIVWVRGRLLGQGNLSVYGLALGSPASPPKTPRVNLWPLDAHELAHAVLDQHRTADSDPPMLLHEGWASSQSGVNSVDLARTALEVRRQGRAPRLRDLVGPHWYHQDSGPVYSIGAALVDFLLRRHGAEKFLRLYVECRPDTFEADCRAVLGVGLDELETEFWKDAEWTAGPAAGP